MFENTSLFRDSGKMHSAGDIMRQMAQPAQPVDFVTGKVISKKNLSGASKYSYCPFCYQRAKRGGQDIKALRPLISVTYKNLYQVNTEGDMRVVYEKQLECTVCREKNGKPKRITLDDFSNAYAEIYKEEETPFIKANDKDALIRAGFSEYAEFCMV